MRPAEHRFHFAQQIGVGEHHAFGIGSGARGVEQGSDHIRCNGSGREAAGARGENAVKIGHHGGRSRIRTALFLSSAGIDEGSLDRQRANRLPRGGEMFDVAK